TANLTRSSTPLSDDDDRDVWLARGYGAGAVAAGWAESKEREPRSSDDSFDVGSGGRSGGGGASASWGDADAGSAPVIVDPFAAESGAVGAAIAGESAMDAEKASESWGGDAESPSSSDGGTSY